MLKTVKKSAVNLCIRYDDPSVKLIRLRSAILFSLTFLIVMANPAMAAESLPPIDAHRFDVKPIQKSTSGKIYLFESTQVIPKTGNLILIYEHDKPAMAFRVLKNDPNKKQFVGKRVRRYDVTSELITNQSYSSIEKLADVLPPPPAEPVPAQEPLEEQKPESVAPPTPAPSVVVEPSPTAEPTPIPAPAVTPESQDSELDASSAAALDKIEESNEEDDEIEPIEVEESSRLDPFNNFLSVSAGYFGNSSGFSGNSALNNGFSLSYARALFHDVFFLKKIPQDSLALELGVIYYQIINQDGGNDLYTLLPFFGNLLYQLHLSSTFSVNAYTGLQYNYMSGANNPGKSAESLQGVQLNFGLGFFYTIGPQWALRVDLGWDRITGGLCIKW